MFISQKPQNECIGTDIIQSAVAQITPQVGGYPGYIPIPDTAMGASTCLIQVYYNPAELPVGVTAASLSATPLVTIDEFTDVLVDPINDTWATPGMKLLNFANYLIESPKNIQKAKIIPFNSLINVYIVLNYYK